MQKVNISELRANLLSYLKKARDGEEIAVTSHGEVLATILPPTDKREKAKKELKSLAKSAIIGDIVSPTDEDWESMK